MKYLNEMRCPSEGKNGVINLSDRWFTSIGKINKTIKMIVEVPVLFYSNNPAGGEVSAKKIGAFTYFNYNPEVRNVESIGRFCSFGQNVVIGVGGHSTTALTHHQIFECKQFWAEPFWDYEKEWVYGMACLNLEKEEKRKKKTTIGNDVWIGCNAIVLSGVNIGNGAIIAAGAVVTKDVPPYSIVAGNPAKVIKYRFDDGLIQKLQDLQWWEYGANILKGLDISEPYNCIDSLEERILSGAEKYKPDKFEFDASKNTITKIYAKTNERKIIYKFGGEE